LNTGSHERNPDLVWAKLCEEATHVIAQEPILASYVYNCILNHRSLASALSVILANKLADEVMSAVSLRELFEEAFESAPTLIVAASADIRAVYERDAATSNYLPVVLFASGALSQGVSVDSGSSPCELPVDAFKKGTRFFHPESQLGGIRGGHPPGLHIGHGNHVRPCHRHRNRRDLCYR